MKKQFFSFLIIATIFCFAAKTYGQSADVIKEEKIKVGFHCPNGKALIEKELIKATGVTSVVADLETKIVTINYIEGKTNKDELVKAIEKTGYTTEYTQPNTTIIKACIHEQPQN